MRLATLVAAPPGPERLPPLVIAHGLFGQARNWSALSKRLAAAGRRVVAVDMRHHGATEPAPAGGYEEMAGDLADTMAAEGAGDLLGHSMGGKAAMAMALTRPGGLRRLVVADIAPIAYGGRDHLPYIRAMQAVDLSRVERRSQAEAALADAVPDRALRLFLVQSLELSPEGARWRLELDRLAEAMPRIMGFPELAATWDGPALFLAAGAADYLTPSHRPRIRSLFPGAVFETVEGAGHWLHAEKPEAFLAAVERFLSA